VSQSTIAERYARAIFELADEANQVEPVTAAIRGFAEAYQSSEELRRVLGHGLDDAHRESLLKDLTVRLTAPALADKAIRFLAFRRRLPAIAEIATLLTRLADEKAGVIRATVTSAAPLSEDYYRELTREIEQRTSRRVIIDRKEDPSLLAGVVTRIGDQTVDGSLRGRLDAIERQLLASQ
jgi:F-type H+-transporting ATPase subunit delta